MLWRGEGGGSGGDVAWARLQTLGQIASGFIFAAFTISTKNVYSIELVKQYTVKPKIAQTKI